MLEMQTNPPVARKSALRRARKTAGCVASILLLIATASPQATPIDYDHDGLADASEQALLTQFTPTFMVSKQDCDLLPAAMVPGEATPRVVERSGAIYTRGGISP
jgi:hypothetical protein